MTLRAARRLAAQRAAAENAGGADGRSAAPSAVAIRAAAAVAAALAAGGRPRSAAAASPAPLLAVGADGGATQVASATLAPSSTVGTAAASAGGGSGGVLAEYVERFFSSASADQYWHRQNAPRDLLADLDTILCECGEMIVKGQAPPHAVDWGLFETVATLALQRFLALRMISEKGWVLYEELLHRTCSRLAAGERPELEIKLLRTCFNEMYAGSESAYEYVQQQEKLFHHGGEDEKRTPGDLDEYLSLLPDGQKITTDVHAQSGLQEGVTTRLVWDAVFATSIAIIKKNFEYYKGPLRIPSVGIMPQGWKVEASRCLNLLKCARGIKAQKLRDHFRKCCGPPGGRPEEDFSVVETGFNNLLAEEETRSALSADDDIALFREPLTRCMSQECMPKPFSQGSIFTEPVRHRELRADRAGSLDDCRYVLLAPGVPVQLVSCDEPWTNCVHSSVLSGDAADNGREASSTVALPASEQSVSQGRPKRKGGKRRGGKRRGGKRRGGKRRGGKRRGGKRRGRK